jgi:hypothetical protein
VLFIKHCYDVRINEDVIGGECSRCELNEKCFQNCCWEL